MARRLLDVARSVAQVALLSLLAAAASQSAHASCPFSRQFVSGNLQLFPQPDGFSVVPDGLFWALGSGNPALGAGVDSGSQDFCLWGYDNYYYNCWEPAELLQFRGDWGGFGIDGCMDEAGSSPGPDPDECLGVLLSESTSVGSFAVLMTEAAGTYPDPSIRFDFTRAFDDNIFFGQPVELGLIPRPTVTRIRPSGNLTEISATVLQGLLPGRGQQLHPACPGNIFSGFELFKTTMAPGGRPPRQEQWKVGPPWTGVGAVTPIRSEITFTLDCSAGQETVLASAYAFEDSFTTRHVSRPTDILGTARDTDGDGTPDACDTCTDTDEDGRGDPGFLANACLPDSCPMASDPGGFDADGDGRGDACDACPGQVDPVPHALFRDVNSFVTMGPFAAAGAGGRIAYRAMQDGSAYELYSVVPGGQPVKLNGPLIAGGEVLDFRLSHDGRTVLYWADQRTDNVIELFAVPVAGGPTIPLGGRLAPGPDVASRILYEISPDDIWVVYLADPSIDGVFDYYAAPLNGSQPPTQLTFAGREVYYLRISPTSTHVLLAGLPNDLVSMPITGGPRSVLTSRGGLNATFTPDGTQVIYSADELVAGRNELFSIPVGGGTRTRLSAAMPPAGDVISMQVSPNGQRVVYWADQEIDQVFEMYSTTLSGGPVKLTKPITGGPSGSGFSRITPDSRTVVYVLDQDTRGTTELFAVPIDGGAVRKLSGPMVAGGEVLGIGSFELDDPMEITPDSATVVYRADQEIDNTNELYSVPVAGGQVTRISHPLPQFAEVGGFQIAPDGATVLYRAGSSLFVNPPKLLYATPVSESRVFRVSDTALEWGPHHASQNIPLVADLFQYTADGSGAVVRTGAGLFHAPLECLRAVVPPPLQLSITAAPEVLVRRAGGGVMQIFIAPAGAESVDLGSLTLSVNGAAPVEPTKARWREPVGTGAILTFSRSQIVGQADRCGEVSLELTGSTTDGRPVLGTSSIEILCTGPTGRPALVPRNPVPAEATAN